MCCKEAEDKPSFFPKNLFLGLFTEFHSCLLFELSGEQPPRLLVGESRKVAVDLFRGEVRRDFVFLGRSFCLELPKAL